MLMIRILLCASLLLVFSGCSEEDLAPTYKVTGVVKYKDKPVEGASVVFHGDGNVQQATAVTDSDGRFSLSTQGREGAIEGKHKVTVSKPEVQPAKEMSMDEAAQAPPQPVTERQTLPARYADFKQTDLEFEVSTDESKNDFEIILKD